MVKWHCAASLLSVGSNNHLRSASACLTVTAHTERVHPGTCQDIRQLWCGRVTNQGSLKSMTDFLSHIAQHPLPSGVLRNALSPIRTDVAFRWHPLRFDEVSRETGSSPRRCQEHEGAWGFGDSEDHWEPASGNSRPQEAISFPSLVKSSSQVSHTGFEASTRFTQGGQHWFASNSAQR